MKILRKILTYDRTEFFRTYDRSKYNIIKSHDTYKRWKEKRNKLIV